MSCRTPSAGKHPALGGAVGRYGLSWMKVFLEGDDRYRQFLLQTPADATDFRNNL